MPDMTDELERYRAGDLLLDAGTREVTRDGREITLPGLSFDLLLALTRHAPNIVSIDELMDEVWAGRVVNVETVTKRVEMVREALGDDSHEPRYIALVRGHGYRLVCNIESLKQPTDDADIDIGEPSVTHKEGGLTGGRRIALSAFLGLILVAAVYVAYRSLLSSPVESPQLSVEGTTQSAPPVYSIAVLPFVNMSSDPDQEYFSDGITEEILNALSAIQGLRLTSRTSSFSFKEKDVPIPEIAKALGVAHIVEGSVRKSGNRVRITAQLIDASNDRQLWSDTYERALDDIFAIQDEISAAIVAALKEHLDLEVESAPRVIAAANTEAHDAYLRGHHLMVRRGPSNVERATRELEKAIELDPDYAIAHAELAIAILLQRQYDKNKFSKADVVARAGPHAERALVLDSTLAEAHAAAAFVLWFEDNLDEALSRFRQAIQINPNYSIVYTWMALISMKIGNYKEAFAAQEIAVRLDPLSVPAINNYSSSLIKRNRLDEAEQELEKLAALSPAAHANIRANLAYFRGQSANVILASLDVLQLGPERRDRQAELSYQFAAVGLESEALAILEHPPPAALSWLGRLEDAVTTAEARLQRESESSLARRDLGVALAGAGDYARARPILEEMWQRSGGRITGNEWGFFRADAAAALIAIRRDAGEKLEVTELVTAMRDNVRRYREAGIIGGQFFGNTDYEEGLAAYLSGDRQRGLALIAKAVEEWFFIPQSEAYLQVLYDDPGFAPIRASQEARQARERKRFLDIVCTNNPYAAVWQPAEGTCERFAAVGGN